MIRRQASAVHCIGVPGARGSPDQPSPLSCFPERSRHTMRISLEVNGQQVDAEAEPRILLIHFLREVLGLTSAQVGCDTTTCGACTVLLDGMAVKSCGLFAVQVDGREITTIEGISPHGHLHPLQEGFKECHAVQCGFCT